MDACQAAPPSHPGLSPGRRPTPRPPGARLLLRHADTEAKMSARSAARGGREPLRMLSRWAGTRGAEGRAPAARSSQCHRTETQGQAPGAGRGASRQRGFWAKVRAGWGHAELCPETELEMAEVTRLTLKVRKVMVHPLPAWPPASLLGVQVGDATLLLLLQTRLPQSGDWPEVTRLERCQRDGSPVPVLQVALGGRHFSGAGDTLAL